MNKLGKVYKIVVGQSDDVYIGSTFNELKQRFAQHKSKYRAWKQGNIQKKVTVYDLFDKYNITSCRIILIKEYEVCDKNHLFVYEQLWQNKLKCVNKQAAFQITHLYNKQYYAVNKDKELVRAKNYRQNNSEKINNYRKNNKDKIHNFYEANKDKYSEKQKEYYKNNKEKVNERNNNYRKNNKEKIKQFQSVTCECGTIVTRGSLNRHKKSKQHLSFIESNNI